MSSFFSPSSRLSLGIGKDLSALPHLFIFPLKKEIVLEDGALSLKQLGLRLFTFDPTMALKGKTPRIVMIESRGIEYWSGLSSSDQARYKEEKRRPALCTPDCPRQGVGAHRSDLPDEGQSPLLSGERNQALWSYLGSDAPHDERRGGQGREKAPER